MIIQYFTWITLYSLWQILIGIDLPRKHRRTKLKNGMPAPTVYDTSFHANMRESMCMVYGTYLWKRPAEESQRMIDENDFELKDFGIYMILHFVGVMATLICIAWPCYHSQTFHAVMMVVALLVVIIKGAIFYNNVMTVVYADIVQESVETELRKLIASDSEDVERIVVKNIEKDDKLQLHEFDGSDELCVGKDEKDIEQDEHQDLIGDVQN